MIYKIQKKEFDKLKWQRKHGAILNCLLFKAVNGMYYKCDKTGMPGVKEMAEFERLLKDEMKEQTRLI